MDSLSKATAVLERFGPRGVPGPFEADALIVLSSKIPAFRVDLHNASEQLQQWEQCNRSVPSSPLKREKPATVAFRAVLWNAGWTWRRIAEREFTNEIREEMLADELASRRPPPKSQAASDQLHKEAMDTFRHKMNQRRGRALNDRIQAVKATLARLRRG